MIARTTRMLVTSVSRVIVSRSSRRRATDLTRSRHQALDTPNIGHVSDGTDRIRLRPSPLGALQPVGSGSLPGS